MADIQQIAKEVFETFDADKNGSFDRNELKSLLYLISKKLNIPNPSEKDIDEGMIRLDLNKDGKLQFKEFYPFYKDIYNALTNK